MGIITISRELAALGDETANELAKKLRYRLVDKSVLEDRIKSYGVTSSKFQKYDEKKPSFFASLSRDRDDYLHFLKAAILDEAGQGSAVIIGRGAGIILNSVPGVFSVFLVASPEIRLERVKSYFHCDDKRARQIIEKSDNDREGFHSYFFDTRWKDPEHYHLVMNTGYLRPELCAELIKKMRDRIMTKKADTQSALRIEELILAQKIKNHILFQKEISIHFLEASVSGKTVLLYGVANAPSMAEAAVAAAKGFVTDYSIQSEIQVVQDFSVIP